MDFPQSQMLTARLLRVIVFALLLLPFGRSSAHAVDSLAPSQNALAMTCAACSQSVPPDLSSSPVAFQSFHFQTLALTR